MPLDDWSRAKPYVFHDFHTSWLVKLSAVLNQGILPKSFYALVEPHDGRFAFSGVRTSSRNPAISSAKGLPEFERSELAGAIDIHEASPALEEFQEADEHWFISRQNAIGIYYARTDQLVACIELVSPGNKANRFMVDRFVEKVAGEILDGVHVVAIDVYRWKDRANANMFAAVWKGLGQSSPAMSPDALTIASYRGLPALSAFAESCLPRDSLPAQPLFLTRDFYVNLPLEETYQQTRESMARPLRAVLDG